MMKTFKRIAVLMIFSLLTPIFLSFLPSIGLLSESEAYAAEAKAKLATTKVTVGINSSPEYIYIENYNENATYSYSSANKKIAAVNEYGGINGVAIGKTTVAVTETLDGKKTKLGNVSVTVANASFADKKVNVGLNSQNFLFLKYQNFEAKYTYKSANTKIAKIDEYGTITGIALGKTTISAVQSYKGKTTKLGSITVNVIKASLALKEIEVPITSYASSEVPIDCRNPKATYQYTSSNTKIAAVDKNNGWITGMKEGSTTISVSETYNKKTTKLGSVKIKVVGASILPESKSIEIALNSSHYVTDIVLMKNLNYDADYTCTSEDSSIVTADYIENEWGDESFKVKGTALGTTTITVYEEFNDVKKKLGTVKVTVKEYPVTKFEFDNYSFEEKDGVKYKNYTAGYDYSWDSLRNYLFIEPYNATTAITYTSSDESIIKVDSNGLVTPVAEGTATITATCGEFTEQFEAVVTADTGEDW